MVFWVAGSIGTMFSGFLQAAAYTNLHGVKGLEGWRWLFVIDGIITIPLALAGFLFFPNMPSGAKTWWINEEEHTISIKRMEAIGRAGKQPWTRAKARKILTSWHTYLLRTSLLYAPTYSSTPVGFWDCALTTGITALCYIVWNNGGAYSYFPDGPHII